MLKRILGIFLCITMLFLATFPVTAVNSEETTGGDTEATPTLESILNDYHAKSAALKAESTAGTSTYSRTVSEDPQDQLKQETIAELYAAGYAAYDLNSSTYQSLERQLSTDFSEMGLDPDGSYIVVISGEEDTSNQTSPGNNSRVITLPPHVWEGGDVPYFSYTYNGTVYNMRFLTVLSNDQEDQVDEESILMSDSSNSGWLEGFLSFGNEVVGLLDRTIISDLVGAGLGISGNDVPLEWIQYTVTASWDITYTQIQSDTIEGFSSCASVDRVYVDYNIAARYYSSTAGSDSGGGYVVRSYGDEYGIRYSDHYFDQDWQKLAAAKAFEAGMYDFEEVEYIEVAFYNDENEDKVIEMLLNRPPQY